LKDSNDTGGVISACIYFIRPPLANYWIFPPAIEVLRVLFPITVKQHFLFLLVKTIFV